MINNIKGVTFYCDTLYRIKTMSKNYIPFKKITISKNDIDLNTLIEVQQIIAKLVDMYGKQYLPAFIRIHERVHEYKKEQSYETIALQIANDNIKYS